MKKLKKGQRIRVNVPTMGGWKGKATVVNLDPGLKIVEFLKEGEKLDKDGRSRCFCMFDEASIIKEPL